MGQTKPEFPTLENLQEVISQLSRLKLQKSLHGGMFSESKIAQVFQRKTSLFRPNVTLGKK